MLGNTDFDQMNAESKKRYFRFDPTVSTGTILQLVSFLIVAAGAWATYQADKATTALELSQVKAAAAADRMGTKEALSELRQDVKGMTVQVNEMSRTLAVIEARQSAKTGQ